MGRGTAVTEEKVQEMRKLRSTGMSFAAIGGKCGVSDVTAARYTRDVEIVENFAETGVNCPACGEKLPKRAKFCFMCGEKILSEREKLALRVSTLRRIYSFLPEQMRDSTIEVLNDVLAFLDGKEEKKNES